MTSFNSFSWAPAELVASRQLDQGYGAEYFLATPVPLAQIGEVLVVAKRMALHLNPCHACVRMLRADAVGMSEAILALITTEGLLARVKALVGSELARLDERFVAAWVGAAVGPLASVNALVSLERFLPGKGALAKAAPDGALRLGPLLDERRNLLQLGPAALLKRFQLHAVPERLID